MLVALVGCASPSPTSEERPAGAGTYLEDAALTTRVKAALAAAGASPMAVQVTTQGGVVQLSGFVDTPEDVQRAGEVARQVKGVKQVHNDIRVAPRS
jgi:osmotically-inducible protein OsmY